MSKVKSILMGLGTVAVFTVVVFALVRRFAPENVKNYFRV